MQTVTEIDQQLRDLPNRRQEAIAQIEAAKQRFDAGDHSAAHDITELEELVRSLARTESRLEIDRTNAQREAQLAECERIARQLQKTKQAGDKLRKTADTSLAACNDAFTALAEHNRAVDALTEQYNRVALALGKEPELTADPVAQNIEGAITGLLSAIRLLATKRDLRARSKLGLVGTAKLALASVLQGFALTPDQINTLKDFVERGYRHADEVRAAIQFDREIAQVPDYVKAIKAAYPPAVGFPIAPQRFPQEPLNEAVKLIRAYEHALEFPDGEPAPQAPDEETQQAQRANSTPIQFGPWMR